MVCGGRIPSRGYIFLQETTRTKEAGFIFKHNFMPNEFLDDIGRICWGEPARPVDVRKELDVWLPQGPKDCFLQMYRNMNPPPYGSGAPCSYPDSNTPEGRVALQMQKIREYFERMGWEAARPEVEAMTRYYLEGFNANGDGYREDEDVYNQLGVGEFLEAGGAVVDLGCGPGNYLRSRPANQALGVDISPTFAVANPNVVCGTIDAPFSTFMEQIGPFLERLKYPRWAISSLTLDRVRDPSTFLDTLARVGDQVTVATLLPIVPVDDGPEVKNRITYTPRELRLTPGSSEAEDRARLLEYLSDTFRVAVESRNLPYTCRSSDGVQVYDNYWAFTFTPNS